MKEIIVCKLACHQYTVKHCGRLNSLILLVFHKLRVITSIYLLYINITRNVNTRVANWLRWHVFEKRISGDASPHLSHAHATRLSSATLCLIVPTHIPNS